jgi:hypothetical protein
VAFSETIPMSLPRCSPPSARGRFDHVVFAVLDRQRGALTYAAFTRVFRIPAER